MSRGWGYRITGLVALVGDDTPSFTTLLLASAWRNAPGPAAPLCALFRCLHTFAPPPSELCMNFTSLGSAGQSRGPNCWSCDLLAFPPPIPSHSTLPRRSRATARIERALTTCTQQEPALLDPCPCSFGDTGAGGLDLAPFCPHRPRLGVSGAPRNPYGARLS